MAKDSVFGPVELQCTAIAECEKPLTTATEILPSVDQWMRWIQILLEMKGPTSGQWRRKSG